MDEKPASGLWRRNAETPEGKYLVKRRDGTVVEWLNFVIGAKDPAAPAALLAYADEAERLGFDAGYVRDVRWLAGEFERYRDQHGDGDPDRGRHRVDDRASCAATRCRARQGARLDGAMTEPDPIRQTRKLLDQLGRQAYDIAAEHIPDQNVCTKCGQAWTGAETPCPLCRYSPLHVDNSGRRRVLADAIEAALRAQTSHEGERWYAR